MVVAEYNKKGAIVRIHDDYIKSKEESLEIMKRVEENAYRSLVAQYMKKNMPENSDNNGI